MEFLKKFWNWLLGQTTIDEKIEAKVAEVKEEVIEAKEAIETSIEEIKDVAEVVTPKKRTRKSKV